MYKTLEDEFGDVVAKARRGQEMALGELADKVDIDINDIERIEEYEYTPPQQLIEQLARVLGLDAEKLKGSAGVRFYPNNPEGEPTDGMTVKMMILGSSFLMNGYIAACNETKKAICIDPGFDPDAIFNVINGLGVELDRIVLTHGHHDHIGALEAIHKSTGAPVSLNSADMGLVGELTKYVGDSLEDGDRIEVGQLSFVARATPGHTQGGMSVIGEGVAFVGDALFAGSLGGTRSRENYDKQHAAVEKNVLSLPNETILYPGHGPATTVGEERKNNPYFVG